MKYSNDYSFLLKCLEFEVIEIGILKVFPQPLKSNSIPVAHPKYH